MCLPTSLLTLVLAVLRPFSGPAPAHHRPPPPVVMRVNVGYGEQFRSSAWVPVRVALRNKSSATIGGRVEIPTGAVNAMGPPQPFHALYQSPVVLPAGATKQVTLYIPGSDVDQGIEVRFRSGGHTLVSGSDDTANSFDDQSLVAGVLSTDPTNAKWLDQVNLQGTTLATVPLSAATLDALPDALATFDEIIVTNVDTSRLSPDQLSALDRYVRNGGSLLLVGGPDWQETLHPLPTGLIPGQLAGSRTVPDLSGLRSAGYGAPQRQPTDVSVLAHPTGSVVMSEAGVPLVVRSSLGTGQIVYLAFDPALDPVAHWTARSAFLSRLVSSAAPLAASRASWPQGSRPPMFMGKFLGPWGGLGTELSNVPAAALPSLILFVVLTLLYILLLGPANFLVLRRLRRRELSWITVPVLALACVGSTYGVAYHLKGDTVLINTVGVVQLDGSHGPYPATLYSGLFAPVRGDYQLTYGTSGLPTTLPQFVDYGPGPPPQTRPLGLRFQEGNQTRISFVSMNMWSMRDVALRTSVGIPGSLHSDLHLDAAGNIVGTIHNGTSLTLIRPVIVAGRTVRHLPDLPSGATLRVAVRPSGDIHNQQPFWFRLYVLPRLGGQFWGGPRLGVFGGGIGISSVPCCYGPSPPSEKTLTDRIRNVGSMIPEVQSMSSLGEVLLTAWSEQPLGSISVDGASPHRRDLNLIMSPLSVGLRSGAFTLRQGTLGAHLVDDVPVQSQRCCPWGPSGQPISFGSGGSATFQFDIPRAGRVHFKRLTLSADAGGADGTHIGSVYDWRRVRWVGVDLSRGDALLRDPSRFVSPTGALLVKLRATDGSGDITIRDPHQDLQLSGTGVAT